MTMHAKATQMVCCARFRLLDVDAACCCYAVCVLFGYVSVCYTIELTMNHFWNSLFVLVVFGP